MARETYTINAAGKTLGRVATEAAKALMGKMDADYTPNKRSDVKVTIENAGKLHITEKKRQQTVFTRYSGFPGGLKKETLSNLQARKPGEALKIAIRRMLPRNTMLTARMKNLTVKQ